MVHRSGGLISPILANVYLHYALDKWFETYITTKFKICKLVRYADDFIAFFETEAEAKKFKKELKGRLAKYDLYLEPSKTHIIPFGKNSTANSSFDFLGFNISGTTDTSGNYRLNFITSSKKYENKKNAIKKLVNSITQRNYKHSIISINHKLKGFYSYFNVDTNIDSINNIYNYAVEILAQHLKKHKIKSSAYIRCNKLHLAKPDYSKTKDFN